jgi:hypothetical protein
MSQRPLHEKVLDVVVYAPIGLATQVSTDLPTLVKVGRERVQVARWVGEMAVTFGRRELERRLTQASHTPVLEPVVALPLAVVASHEPPAQPFEGYEQLAAAQVVQLLGRLPHAELVMVRDYEQAHRQRRTVLAKLQQLLGE